MRERKGERAIGRGNELLLVGGKRLEMYRVKRRAEES